MQSEYLYSAQKPQDLRPSAIPEFAFVGRSNSGKSSLLNALLGRKNLARTSRTPGRTQMVNFFECLPAKDEKLLFADLPGYGYNSAPQDIRSQWQGLLSSYMQRANLKALLFLRDCRRSFEDFELDYMTELSKFCPIMIVLTKSDKLKQNEKRALKQKVAKKLATYGISTSELYLVSSLKKQGTVELFSRLNTMAAASSIPLHTKNQ